MLASGVGGRGWAAAVQLLRAPVSTRALALQRVFGLALDGELFAMRTICSHLSKPGSFKHLTMPELAAALCNTPKTFNGP